MAALPPLPAILRSAIEIFGPPPGALRWGSEDALWGGVAALWVAIDWQNVTPQSMNARVSWGADTVQGVLSIPAAGDWSVTTYDPERLLDPSNNESPFASALHPGNPVRLRFVAIGNPSLSRVIRQGKIDTIGFNLDTLQGNLRATDGVAGLVSARIPAGTTGAPTTLRAMARWAVAKAGLSTVVESDPVDSETSLPLPDPPIGAGLTDEASVWQWLLTGALDCLHAVWMDNNAVLRFRSFGSPRDLGLALGGAAGIAFDDLDTESSLQGVYSRVIAFDDGAPTTPISKKDEQSFSIFGDAFFQRDRVVPDGDFWATAVLADRSRADLTYRVGTLRPQLEQQLADLIDAGMADIAHIAVESVIPPIAIDARVLGGSFEANTTSGWSAKLVAYIPGTEWEDAEVPPPEPPDPTPPPTQSVTRNYACTKDTRASLTSGNAKYGEGTGPTLPVGAYSGWRNRAFLDFAAIDWTGVSEVVSAELRVTTSDQDKVAFGGNPKVIAKRITGSWNEGSASTPSSGNATVYPGPSVTSSGQTVKNITESEQTLQAIDVTAIVRAWAPTGAGGSAQTKRGIALFSYSEDATGNTTEFWSREHGGGAPQLRLVVKIPA
jgi:hypothetical protein